MTRTLRSSQPWQASDIDRWMLLVIGLNVAGALWLGHSRAQLGLALQVALPIAAVSAAMVWRWHGQFIAGLGITTGLVALTALQIHLSGGALEQHFNVFVSLSLVLAYRDWRLIALGAVLFGVHHLAFDRLLASGVSTYCLSQPDLGKVMVHIGFVLAQAGLLGSLAWREQRAAREARELEVLVNAMGREGRIRLSLAVMRAETPAGQRLQQVQQRMAEAMAEVQAAGQRIEAAAHQVADGSSELMRRTEATAMGLRDSAMCLEQIGVIVQHSTEASNEARTMSSNAQGMADNGNRLVADVVKTMQAIEHSSRRISEITAVIDSIAFQTNILALNAAVEAARAGEQGRGFAVVAGEVRSLAHRSAEAAREIKALIGESASTVAAGTQLVGGAGATMNELVTSVRRVGELFQSMMADTTEQMQGLSTVSQSIAELATGTQQNVSVATQSEQAAADLRDQVDRLAQVLNAFRLTSGPAVAGAGAGTGVSLQAVAPGASHSAGAGPDAGGGGPGAPPAARRSAPPAATSATAAPATGVEFF